MRDNIQSKSRNRLLFFLWSTVLLSLLFVSGLPGLSFQPPTAFDLGDFLQAVPGLSPNLLYQLVIVALVIYIIGLFILFPAGVRRWVWAGLLLLGIGLLSVVWLAGNISSDAPVETAQPSVPLERNEAELLEANRTAETSVIEVAPLVLPPQWVVVIIAFGVALLLLTVVAGATWFLWEQYNQPDPPLAGLAREAQEAIESLGRGATLHDVVMRCYHDMQHIVGETHGVRRPGTTTPREFEVQLTGLGLPHDAVSGLTRLFEEVRYGTREPGDEEEKRAIDSLTAIIEACRGMS